MGLENLWVLLKLSTLWFCSTVNIGETSCQHFNSLYVEHHGWSQEHSLSFQNYKQCQVRYYFYHRYLLHLRKWRKCSHWKCVICMVYLLLFYYSPESPLVHTKYCLFNYGLTVFLNLNVFKPFQKNHKEEDIKMTLSSTSTKT